MFWQTVRSPKPCVCGGALGYGTLRAVERRLRLPVGNPHGSATWAHFLAENDSQSGSRCSGQDVSHVEELLAGAGSADGQHRANGFIPTKETGGGGSLKGMSLASQSVARPSPMSSLLQLVPSPSLSDNRLERSPPLGRVSAAIGPYLDGSRSVGRDTFLTEGNEILYGRGTYFR